MTRPKKGARKARANPETDPRPQKKGLQQLGEDLEIHAKAWIAAGGEAFLAYGRILLLEGIRDLGSISAAARSIRMSYRRAWWHIETMNRLAKRPLVKTSVGGKAGGGAQLTPEGVAAVSIYRVLDRRTKTFEGRIKKELSERS
jgi:molybdate transport system regulatory protein